MRTIGLIGGMSFESTEVYYRLINEMVRARLTGFASADLMMHSVNFAEIVKLQKSGRWDLAGKILSDSAKRLEAGGAQCILICANTMHLVAADVAAAASIPLIHIIDETAKTLAGKGLARPLLLATRYTMEQGFYTDRMKLLGMDVMVPDADDRTALHNLIFDELCVGKVTESARSKTLAIIEKAKAAGADSVILGCTELCLLLDPDNLALPGIDSAAVHAQAAVEFSLSPDTAG